jgi:hypothetical protein
MTINLSLEEISLLRDLVITEADRLENQEDDAYLDEFKVLVRLAEKLNVLRREPAQDVKDFDDEVPF